MTRTVCGISLLMIIIVSMMQGQPTNFYSKFSGNLDQIATWGTNPDGSGTPPASFTGDNQIFIITNNPTATIGAPWVVSGANSKVVVGNGTSATAFTVPSIAPLTGTIDLSDSATLNLQHLTFPTFGTVSPLSNLNIALTSTSRIRDTLRLPAGPTVFNDFTLSLQGTSGSTLYLSSNLTINHLLSLTKGVLYSATKATTYTVNVGPNGIISGAGGSTSIGIAVNLLGAAFVGGNVDIRNLFLNADSLQFNPGNTIIRELQINGGTVCTANLPSIRIVDYNTGGVYTPGGEWSDSATSGHGVPSSVQIFSGTTLQLSSQWTQTVLNDLTIKGTLRLSEFSGAGLRLGGSWYRLPGGSFVSNHRAVYFTSMGSWHELSASDGEEFDSLIVDTDDLSLLSEVTAKTLVLANGVLLTDQQPISIDTGGTVVRTNGWVSGMMKKKLLPRERSFTFDFGGSSDVPLPYMPIVANFDSIISGGTITAQIIPGDHQEMASSGIDRLRYVHAVFHFENAGVSFTSCNLKFTYPPELVDTAARADKIVGRCFDGMQWKSGIRIGERTDTSVQLLSPQHFGDFIFGEPAPGAWNGLPVTDFWKDQGDNARIVTDYYSVSIVDEHVAWIGGDGGTVLRTTDGGTTWDGTQIPPYITPMYNVEGVTANLAFVCDSGKLFRTNDGGSVWTVVYNDMRAGAFMNAVHMFDTLKGVALGDPVEGAWVLLHTSDGGQTWANLPTLPQISDETGWNNSFEWTDSLHGWFTTTKAWLYRTTNGGTSWISETTPSSANGSLSFINDSVGMVVGNPMLLLTTTGGTSWAGVDTFTAISYVAGVDAPLEQWWRASGNTIWETTNRGTSWFNVHQGWSEYNTIRFKKMSSGAKAIGYAVGRELISRCEIPLGPPIQTNLTAKWNLVSTPVLTRDSILTIFPSSNSPAYSYASVSGYTASPVPEPGKGYWLKFNAPATCAFVGPVFPIVIIPVSEGWNLIGSLSTPVSVQSISSAQPDLLASTFWGYQGSYVATDTLYPGKGYWVKVNRNDDLILASTPLAAGSKNHLGILPTSEMPPAPPGENNLPTAPVPDAFALQQNYPNPFNPTTTIPYQLPASSHVRITIYNTLGQIITHLVDEVKPAGHGEATWNASSIPSGIYYYRLDATSIGNNGMVFSEMRRMALIK